MESLAENLNASVTLSFKVDARSMRERSTSKKILRIMIMIMWRFSRAYIIRQDVRVN